MSARALAACSFWPAADQTVAIGYKTADGAAEIQFREALWREYRLEAINAGFSPAQATAYASALSSEMSLVVEASGTPLVGRHWFYQGRARVVLRTFASAPIRTTHRGKSKATGRTAPAGASVLAGEFRWWNAGGRELKRRKMTTNAINGFGWWSRGGSNP